MVRAARSSTTNSADGLTISLNDLADDGSGTETDNVGASITGVVGGSERDVITGSAVTNDLSGGPGDDDLNGARGDDFLTGSTGNDDIVGGDGNDTAPLRVQDGGGIDVDVTVSLDNVANDGGGDETTNNIHSDVENVDTGDANDILDGSAGDNSLNGNGGNDIITGAGGTDVLSGGDGDDTMNARDTVADLVDCGVGADTANVDTRDEVIGCDPAEVNVDAAPTASLTSPAEGATLQVGATPVTVNASADTTAVTLRVDGALIGTDTSAPYSFVYSPTAADVGARTLQATATDDLTQSGSASRSVTVAAPAPPGGGATTSGRPVAAAPRPPRLTFPRRQRRLPRRRTRLSSP